jgi:hypothetical protein
LARKRISGCAGEDLFGTQCVARICEARHDVVVSYSGVIRHDVGFLPSVGQQSNHESTESRVPRMTGLPASTVGSSAMRECSVVIMSSSNRARYYPKSLPDAISKRYASK